MAPDIHPVSHGRGKPDDFVVIEPDARPGWEVKMFHIDGVVVGAGNFLRGSALARHGQIHQSTADYMGMLATIINGLALREALAGMGRDCRLMSALEVPAVGERFIRARALRHLEKGRILILAAGTGNPYFTTDTCAALRGAELGADILLKATKVDGVYTGDPVSEITLWGYFCTTPFSLITSRGFSPWIRK